MSVRRILYCVGMEDVLTQTAASDVNVTLGSKSPLMERVA